MFLAYCAFSEAGREQSQLEALRGILDSAVESFKGLALLGTVRNWETHLHCLIIRGLCGYYQYIRVTEKTPSTTTSLEVSPVQLTKICRSCGKLV